MEADDLGPKLLDHLAHGRVERTACGGTGRSVGKAELAVVRGQSLSPTVLCFRRLGR
jgi:hypothetical protein